MKKVMILSLSVIAMLALSACGNYSTKEIEDYLLNATPESSVIELFVSDGKTTDVYMIADVPTEKKILIELSDVKAVPVADWNPTANDLPFYGIWIGSSGGELDVFFAGDYAITGEGKAYKYKYDFRKLLGQYEWRLMHTIDGISVPCLYYAALTQVGWNQDILNRSSFSVCDRFEVSGTEDKDGVIDITPKNNTGNELRCGEYWYFEVNLNGVWYSVPSKKPVVVNDIAYIVPNGQTYSKTCDIKFYYGDIPKGTYRIVVPGHDSDGNAVYGAYEFIRP